MVFSSDTTQTVPNWRKNSVPRSLWWPATIRTVLMVASHHQTGGGGHGFYFFCFDHSILQSPFSNQNNKMRPRQNRVGADPHPMINRRRPYLRYSGKNRKIKCFIQRNWSFNSEPRFSRSPDLAASIGIGTSSLRRFPTHFVTKTYFLIYLLVLF